MKPILALCTVALLALSVPAFAQDAGQPGASGESGPTTGHQMPGTAGVTSGHMGSMMMHHHHYHHHYRKHHHHMM